MFYVHDGVWLDPSVSAPQIFLETKGLVVDKHRILLPAFKNTMRWKIDGTNIPVDEGDIGTPDIYVIPEFTQQDGNLLEIFIDLFNVTDGDQEYSLRVEIHQEGYEPDKLLMEKGTLGTSKGKRTESHGIFVPLLVMK